MQTLRNELDKLGSEEETWNFVFNKDKFLSLKMRRKRT